MIKRMKDKAFARAVNRDDLRRGAEELGLPLDQHIANVITFMRERADALGLRGTLNAARRRCSCIHLRCPTWLTAMPVRLGSTMTVVQLDDVTVIYGDEPGAAATSRPRSRTGAVGLLGPNGAGKSTMLKALLGFVMPDRRADDACSASTSRSRRSRFARASATCRRATRTFPA